MSYQNDLFPVVSDWKPPRVSDLVSFRAAGRVSIDTETYDPLLTKMGMGSLRGGEVVGYSYAIEGGPRFYVPLRHRGGGNVDDSWAALGWLREEAKHFRGELVGANLQYDLCFLASSSVEFPHAKMRDVQIAEALIDEMARSYSLESLCHKYGLEPKDQSLLEEAARVHCRAKTKSEVKKAIAFLPSRYVGAYGEADADRPLLILREQEKAFEKEDLWAAWDLESDVIPALLAVRRRGIKIDLDHLDRVESYSRNRMEEAVRGVNTLHSGPALRSAELNMSAALHRTLESGGINNPFRSKNGKPSVTKEFLETCPGDMGKLIREAKKWEKMISTFASGIREHLIDGRIHCTYNQTRGEDESGEGVEGASTFRLSCKDPNLQQQPGRDPETGPMWRAIYLPEEGRLWASNDYSQQEPRFTTHYAAVMDLPRAQEAAKRYCEDPTTDNHQMMADLTKGRVKRKAAKEIYLGICYGQGGAKTADKIGLPTSFAVRPPREAGYPYGTIIYQDEDAAAYRRAVDDGGFQWRAAGAEARELLQTLNAEVPYVSALAKKAEESARKKGSIRTFFGHVAHFPPGENGECDFLRKALNRLIQISSAGQTKRAMVDLHREGRFVQLQVHDELGGSVADRAEADSWADTMRRGAQMRVPSKVDVETGSSWGQSMDPSGLAKVLQAMEAAGC